MAWADKLIAEGVKANSQLTATTFSDDHLLLVHQENDEKVTTMHYYRLVAASDE